MQLFLHVLSCPNAAAVPGQSHPLVSCENSNQAGTKHRRTDFFTWYAGCCTSTDRVCDESRFSSSRSPGEDMCGSTLGPPCSSWTARKTSTPCLGRQGQAGGICGAAVCCVAADADAVSCFLVPCYWGSVTTQHRNCVQTGEGGRGGVCLQMCYSGMQKGWLGWHTTRKCLNASWQHCCALIGPHHSCCDPLFV